MNKEELRQVIREEQREQSKRAVFTVLALIAFGVFLVLLNTFVLSRDTWQEEVDRRQREAREQQAASQVSP